MRWRVLLATSAIVGPVAAQPGPAPSASSPGVRPESGPPTAVSAQPGGSASATPVVPPTAPSGSAGRPGPAPAGSGAAVPPAASASVPQLCVQFLPEGKTPPKLTETFPARALSGHVIELKIVVEHGRGETVLPDGFQLQLAGDQVAALERTGFVLPDPSGPAHPTIERVEAGERATTTVTLRLIALPSEPGRHELVLPPLPLSIARASGELMAVCTRPHEVVVEEPTANSADPKPQRNPAPREQLESWIALRNVVYATLVALPVGALLGWLLLRWWRRPRAVPPPPPPRPPWEVALEELHDVRHAGLIEAERFAEHYDRVSHAVRKYLGERYGFDGLESTTREILGVLHRVSLPAAVMEDLERFLREADLVKFAKLTPTQEQCRIVLERGQSVVERTIPIERMRVGEGS